MHELPPISPQVVFAPAKNFSAPLAPAVGLRVKQFLMRIQAASDLHLEYVLRALPGTRLLAPDPRADVLVLAGDIHHADAAVELFADWPVPVVYVPGNHEFYDRHRSRTLAEARLRAEGSRVRLLDRDECVLAAGGERVRFLGATLWTDYGITPGVTVEAAQAIAARLVKDHHRIADGPALPADEAPGATPRHAKFSPADAAREHALARAWLADRLAAGFDGPTVVVTHHGCHPASIHARFAGDPVNGAFVSDLSDLLPHADLWIHGHVHDSADYRVGRCRVVANPRGYGMNLRAVDRIEDVLWENPEFKADLVLHAS